MGLILIADDFMGLAETLAELIGDEMECGTVCAFEGQSAVDIALEAQPDVVVLDVDMPRLSGIEAAKAILHAQVGAPPLLIAMTGGTRLSEARESGCFNVVFGKPVDSYLLCEAIKAGRLGEAMAEPC